MFTIDSLTKQLNTYMRQRADALKLAEQVTGAIHVIQAQLGALQKQQEEQKENATEERNEQQDSISEHQDRDCSGQEPEASGCDSAE